MMTLVIVGIIILCFVSPVFFCAITHPFKSIYYGIKDLYDYIVHKKWLLCSVGGIVSYIGLFGLGKTLSAVHDTLMDYQRYNGVKVYDYRRKKWVTQRVRIISNVALSIPYEELRSLQQVVEACQTREAYDNEHDTLTVTIILLDEASSQLNSRSFRDNINPLLLGKLLCVRHHYMVMRYTSQRQGMVDALLRAVTSAVIDCRKLWRYQRNYYYDAWEMENANSPLLLRPYKRSCWFVCDTDFEAYDTAACVDNLIKSWSEDDMMSEEEILALQMNTPTDMDAIVKPSRKWRRAQRKRHG